MVQSSSSLYSFKIATSTFADVSILRPAIPKCFDYFGHFKSAHTTFSFRPAPLKLRYGTIKAVTVQARFFGTQSSNNMNSLVSSSENVIEGTQKQLRWKENGRFKLLVTRELPESCMERLKRCKNIDLETQDSSSMPIPRKILLEKIKNKNGVICLLTEKIDSSLLDCAGPNLKIVSTVSVGYDHIDTEECQKRGVLVTNTPDVLTDATAELTVGLTLMVMRKLGIAKDVAMRGEWKQWSLIDPLCGQSLVDKTVGIIGFGNIGYAVAKRLIGFGVSKFIYSSSSSQSRPHPPLYSPSGSVVPFERVSLENLLKLSDVAIATCSLNNSTHGLLNYSKLKLMKDSAVLVNTARGGVAVTDDLVRIVEEKRIWGIGLDVVDPEPLPPTHKLYSFPNVVILPHIGSSTIETRHAMANLAISNILKYVECGQVQTRVV